ncbi:TPA: hypothetical protein ACH3X1_000911 [Trebouxia sp. C0004]
MAPVAYTSVSHVICHSKNPTQSCPRSVVQGRDHSVHSCSRTRQMAYRSKLPCSMQPHLCEAVLLAFIASGNHNAAFAAESQGYVPSPVTVGWEIYAGAIAGVIPFAIGSYQFIARIVSLPWPVYALCSSHYMGCNCALLAKLGQRPM